MQEVTETPTLEPTAEPTATLTLTPTVTPTATPNYYVEMTTPGGEPARLVREITIGDYWIILLLFAVLVSMWSMWLIGRKAKRGDSRG